MTHDFLQKSQDLRKYMILVMSVPISSKIKFKFKITVLSVKSNKATHQVIWTMPDKATHNRLDFSGVF